MIKFEYNGKEFAIDDNYKLKPSDESLNRTLKLILDDYQYPSQGFKTSFVGEKLKEYGAEILDLYDKDMEESPDGIVY